MKFRLKLHPSTYSITLEDFDEDLTIEQLKNKIKKRYLSLRKSIFSLSSNGTILIDDEKKMSDYHLNPGDTLDITVDQYSLITLDQPLTLDEVRDAHRYPLLMHRLVENSHPENHFDFLVIALHALMIESGFQMDTENGYDLQLAKKSSTFYVIRYRHKLCEEKHIRCSLAIMKTDSLITIDGVVNSISQACGKLSFHIGNYLLPNQKGIFPYHNLRHLSRSFKDNLANRLLCKLLEESGQQSTATLIGLPNEIKLRLAKYLPIKSLLALQATCRTIHNTLNDNLLWHDLCIRDFEKAALVSIPPAPDSSMHGKNWFKLYRIMYAQRQATLRHQIKSSAFLHPAFFSMGGPAAPPAHRLLFPDTSATYHPFSPAIYRPMPPTIFRICTANTQQNPSPAQPAPAPAQHHIYCQPFFGLKWVVFFAAATMIPVSPCFHPVWLG